MIAADEDNMGQMTGTQFGIEYHDVRHRLIFDRICIDIYYRSVSRNGQVPVQMTMQMMKWIIDSPLCSMYADRLVTMCSTDGDIGYLPSFI